MPKGCLTRFIEISYISTTEHFHLDYFSTRYWYRCYDILVWHLQLACSSSLVEIDPLNASHVFCETAYCRHSDVCWLQTTVYPKKYAHGFWFAVLCCGYTLTDFPISIRLTSLALWQSDDCPSASKATLMNMDKYFMWIHYERLHNHNKAKHNKTVCIFLGIYCNFAAANVMQ